MQRASAYSASVEIGQILCCGANYGSKHFGICLGYDLRRDQCRAVTYRDERIPFDPPSLDVASLSKEMEELLLLTKFRHWQYEDEVRVVVPLEGAEKEGGLYFHKLNSELRLREVILGARCTMSLDAVRRLVSAQYQETVVFKARLAFKFFSVVPDESTVP